MSSPLARSMSSSTSTSSTQSSYPSKPSQKSPKMSLTQTFYLAHTARGKLANEAAHSDHNLRLLVGHANLLDTLMVELADAEQEQERWFNQTVKGATAEEPKHIQWAETIVEEPEQDWQAEDVESSDTESEYDEDEDVYMSGAIATRKPSPTPYTVSSREIEEDEEEYEDDEAEQDGLALTRVSSQHPPELSHDSDEESEDESMPPSPPQPSLEFSDKQRRNIATTSFYEKQAEHTSEGSISTPDQASFF